MSDAEKPASDDVTTGPTYDATGAATPVAQSTGSATVEAAAAPRPARGTGRRKADRPPRGFARRHKIWIAAALVLALLVGGAGGWYWYLNHKLASIPRIDAGIAENAAKNHHEGGKPLNILLLGADKGEGATTSVSGELADGEWTPFSFRSDTIMIVHIPADRKSLQVVSIPRDTWVEIPGYPYSNGFGKINAAFAYGGPKLATEVIQKFTGLQLDHLAIIDWEGFKDLTSALGGVRIYIPETFYDDSQNITWHQGWTKLKGAQALHYVRTRHGLENGDVGRIARQQNFLRATMGKLLSGGTTRNPITLTKVVNVIASYMTVDQGWDTDEIRGLALSLRSLNSEDVSFLTTPYTSLNGTSPDGQSIVELNLPQMHELFEAVQDDTVSDYIQKYPEDQLAGDKNIG